MLPPGPYMITLHPGWHMARVHADGTFTPVPATLTRPNPIHFELHDRPFTR